MKTLKNYLFIALAMIATFGLASCETKEETEFNLPGTWYTEQEIDYGDDYAWGSGTVMTFNAHNEGTIGTTGEGDYLTFAWRWINEGYNTMELRFQDGSYAYIWGAEAGSRRFQGTWYNCYADYDDRVNGQPFSMRRQ